MRTKPEPPPPLPPDNTPEEERRALLAEIKSTLAECEAQTKYIETTKFQVCASMVGLQGESDRNRIIWKGITEFANHAGSPDRIPEHLGMQLRATLILCTHSDDRPYEQSGSVFELDPFCDVHNLTKRTGVSVDEAFLTLAARMQAPFREMLAWIADPNRCDHSQRVRSLDFLLQQGNEGQSTYQYSVEDKFDDSGNIGSPWFYQKSPSSFASILAPIAKFIFEHLELYHDRVIPLDEAVPIVLCRREGCGKFAVSKRRTKDFCSDSCRTLSRQQEKPEEHAAYMRQYRRRNYSKRSK